VQFYREPKKNTYVFACDDNYLLNHGISCLNSAIKTNNNIHCHVLNPKKDTIKKIQKMMTESDLISLSTSQETDTNKLNPGYYTKMRFYFIDDLFQYSNKIAIIDTDSIFLKNAMNVFEYDICTHERNLSDTKEHKRILTSFVLINKSCVKFIETLKKELKAIGANWWDDQIAIARTIIKYKECQEFLKIKYCSIPLSYTDYTFQNNSYIWTGKGERKNKDKNYVAKLNQYNKTEL